MKIFKFIQTAEQKEISDNLCEEVCLKLDKRPYGVVQLTTLKILIAFLASEIVRPKDNSVENANEFLDAVFSEIREAVLSRVKNIEEGRAGIH